jgi:hypothetical protein
MGWDWKDVGCGKWVVEIERLINPLLSAIHAKWTAALLAVLNLFMPAIAGVLLWFAHNVLSHLSNRIASAIFFALFGTWTA